MVGSWGPIYLFIRLTKQEQDVFIEGQLQATVLLPCSRCAKEIDFTIDEMFMPIFVNGKEPKLQKGGLEKGEMDVTYFQGDEIDLSDVLNEQVVLCLPHQVLCQEACKGLCPQCGSDLNEGACRCKKENANSVFDVLKGLKIRK